MQARLEIRKYPDGSSVKKLMGYSRVVKIAPDGASFVALKGRELIWLSAKGKRLHRFRKRPQCKLGMSVVFLRKPKINPLLQRCERLEDSEGHSLVLDKGQAWSHQLSVSPDETRLRVEDSWVDLTKSPWEEVSDAKAPTGPIVWNKDSKLFANSKLDSWEIYTREGKAVARFPHVMAGQPKLMANGDSWTFPRQLSFEGKGLSLGCVAHGSSLSQHCHGFASRGSRVVELEVISSKNITCYKLAGGDLDADSQKRLAQAAHVVAIERCGAKLGRGDISDVKRLARK